MSEDVENTLLKQLSNKHEKCKNCFCNDLCMFLLLKTGVATTCEDFQKRVQRVVDRELNKERKK